MNFNNAVWQVNGTEYVWNEEGQPAIYEDGDIVNFELSDTDETVKIVGDVAPQSIKVRRDTDLTFNGSGSITGTGSLHKTGYGSLEINTDNNYSGGTTLELGRIALGSATGLGSGEITMQNETILSVADGLTVNNDIALNGSKILLNAYGSTGMHSAATFSGKLSTDQSVVLTTGNTETSVTFTGPVEIATGKTLTLTFGNFTMSNNTVDLKALTVGNGGTLKLESSTLTGLTISDPSTESFTTSEGGVADSAIYTLSGIAGLIANATGSLTLDLGPLADFDITKGITGFEIEGLTDLPSLLEYDDIILNINGHSYNVQGANAGLAGSTNIVLYIPEPSTATLSLLSLAGLMLRRRRKAA